MTEPNAERPTAVLVAVQLPHVSDTQHEADLAELERLVHTLGLDVIGRVTQRRTHLRSGTVLGLGKLRELALWTGGSGEAQPFVARKSKLRDRREREAAEREELDDELDDEGLDEAAPDDDTDDGFDAASVPAPAKRAAVVVVDHELSPRQARNLERATSAEVLDRTQVIVEIFHRHAKSREARLQVEIARLMYVAPRLREAGAGQDRQRGGIGGKGAGESALELDRRKIRDRIAELRRELTSIQAEQATRRSARKEARRVALVGYTNAGKSSLMRALTGSEVYVADKLFATLDTTVRTLHPPTAPKVLVSDTVGFIKKLPHDLVASFRSTLDEAREATLLMHVVDGSDPAWPSHYEVTREVLAEIDAGDIDRLLVINKVDRISEADRATLAAQHPDAVLLSAKDPADVARLREVILARMESQMEEATLRVPFGRERVLPTIHESCRVLEEDWDEEGGRFRVKALPEALARLLAALGEGKKGG
jgi:GTP-binding protein HflX